MGKKQKVLHFLVLVGILFVQVFADRQMTLTLAQCIETALEKSEVIKMEKEKLVESGASVKEARTGFLPKLSAKASFTQLDERPYLDASSMGDFFGGLAEPFLYLAYKDTAGGNPLDVGLLQALSEMSGGTDQSGDGKIYMGDDKLYNLIFTVQQPIFTGFKVLNGYHAAKNSFRAVEENRTSPCSSSTTSSNRAPGEPPTRSPWCSSKSGGPMPRSTPGPTGWPPRWPSGASSGAIAWSSSCPTVPSWP